MTQPSQGGVFPLPTQYNDDRPNLLPASNGATPHLKTRCRLIASSGRERCCHCNDLSLKSTGYFYRGEFYCDSCTWRLADEGEFCCGN